MGRGGQAGGLVAAGQGIFQISPTDQCASPDKPKVLTSAGLWMLVKLSLNPCITNWREKVTSYRGLITLLRVGHLSLLGKCDDSLMTTIREVVRTESSILFTPGKEAAQSQGSHGECISLSSAVVYFVSFS